MSHRKIMILAAVAVLALGVLTSCDRPKDAVSPVRVVEKDTPILEERPAPEELKWTPIPSEELPLWVLPTDPSATSCLTAEGEAKKRILDTGIMGKLGAWEKWGVLP